MSSCFLCECTCPSNGFESRYVSTGLPDPVQVSMEMAIRGIMKGSAVDTISTVVNNNITYTDQQHTNNSKQNYVSYYVKKIEFEMAKPSVVRLYRPGVLNDYVVLFKVPYKTPIVDFGFFDMKNFILYKHPECVLGYKILQNYVSNSPGQENPLKTRQYRIVVDKPFVLGPNDYVGVFYMFNSSQIVHASAKVWFDVV